MRKNLVIAVPKGRIYHELEPLLAHAGIVPEPAFFDEGARQLRFSTNRSDVELIRVRSFDVATFVAFGAADLGVAGSDVLMEFDYPELYAPLDLGIGKCRLAVAEPEALAASDDPRRWSHIRIATKYPRVTKEHFAARGVQAECIKLNGAMEIAPSLGLAERIVDLVSSGATLKANGLVEVETIAEISARLLVGRTAFKTRQKVIGPLVEAFGEAVATRAAVSETETAVDEERTSLPRAIVYHVLGGVGLATGLIVLPDLVGHPDAFEAARTGIDAAYSIVASLGIWCEYLPRLTSGGRALLALGVGLFWVSSVPSLILFGVSSPYEVVGVKLAAGFARLLAP